MKRGRNCNLDQEWPDVYGCAYVAFALAFFIDRAGLLARVYYRISGEVIPRHLEISGTQHQQQLASYIRVGGMRKARKKPFGYEGHKFEGRILRLRTAEARRRRPTAVYTYTYTAARDSPSIYIYRVYTAAEQAPRGLISLAHCPLISSIPLSPSLSLNHPPHLVVPPSISFSWRTPLSRACQTQQRHSIHR